MDLRRFIILTVCMFASVSTFANEKSFWETIAKFEGSWLKSEKDANHFLNLAEEHYSNSDKTDLMLTSLVLKRLDLLKFYGSQEETIAYLEAHIEGVLASHNFKVQYLSELAVLYFESGKFDKYELALEKLSRNNANTFLATVKLITHPTEKNYLLLYSYCEQWCSFLLYHRAIAKYYAISGQYPSLISHVDEVIANYYNFKDIRSHLFLEYLFVAIKCEKVRDEELDDLKEATVSNIGHLEGFHNDVLSIMGTECK